MEQYRDTPSLENKRQLSECYYKMLDIYDVYSVYCKSGIVFLCHVGFLSDSLDSANQARWYALWISLICLGTFSQFADANFDPSGFTSQVLSSNKEEGQGIDIDMCLRMLSIYLETIDADLRDVVVQNQDKLFNQISDIETMKQQYGGVSTRVKAITSSFETIKGEVNSSCKSININAIRLSNYNAVILLLRQITTFRSGVKKIRGYLVDENPSQRVWLRVQKTFQEIDRVFAEGHLASGSRSRG